MGIKGCKGSDLPQQDIEIFSLKGKKTLFYGYTKTYVLLFILPVVIYAASSVLRVYSNTEFDWIALIFAAGVVTFVLLGRQLIHGKRLKYFESLRTQHKGKEVLIGPNEIFISAGELTRGEYNTEKFYLLGTQKEFLKNGLEYILIPLSDLKSFTSDKHLFTFEFQRDGDPLEITIGDYNQDASILDSLTKVLNAKLNNNQS